MDRFQGYEWEPSEESELQPVHFDSANRGLRVER
jgi:hypothetical protein